MSGVAGTDVLIRDVLYFASLAGVRLDADYILVESIRSIHDHIGDQYALCSRVGFTSDRYAMSLEKMIVRNRYIRYVPHACFDGNVIVSHADVRVRNRNVVGTGWIDSFRIRRGSRGRNFYVPYSQRITGAKDVELRRVLKRYLVERE